MPSPFPGVDPFVNQTDRWPRFRRAFLSELVRQLNEWLPDSAVASLGCRPPALCAIACDELSRSSLSGSGHSSSADSSLSVSPEKGCPTSAAASSAKPHAANQLVLIGRQSNPDDILTVIEVVTDAHKQTGPLQEVYAASQRCVLDSSANLIEIDLRIAGDRPIPTFFLEEFLQELLPEPEFLALVSRSWKRHTAGLGYRGYSWSWQERLPTITIPIAYEQGDVPIDLQAVYSAAYDRCYEARPIDYSSAPPAGLSQPDLNWARSIAHQQCHRGE